jgi:hypothetical protein
MTRTPTRAPELTVTATILRVPGGPWTDENTDEVEHGVPSAVYDGELEGRGLLTPQCRRLIAEYIAEVESVTVDEVDEVEIFHTRGDA